MVMAFEVLSPKTKLFELIFYIYRKLSLSITVLEIVCSQEDACTP